MGQKSRSSRSVEMFFIPSFLFQCVLLSNSSIMTCRYFSDTPLLIGEDPLLTSQYSRAFVQALQGTSFLENEDKLEDGIAGTDDKDSSALKMGACCKHFLGNSLEHWAGYDRHSFDAHIDQEDLQNYYLPPFEECTKHAVGVMCSYNAVNGAPTCASDWLLKDELRGRMNFSGYVVTDCGALGSVVRGHHFAIDDVQASVSPAKQVSNEWRLFLDTNL